MKKSDLAEVKKMDTKALKVRAKKTKQEINGLVIDKNTGKMANLKSIKTKRNELAQVLTVLNQKLLLEELEESQKQEDKNAG